MSCAETPGQPPLICPEVVRARFSSVLYSESHGSFGGSLGAGYLYYGLAAALPARVAVCIGSGGGFVPDLLAQAQRDQGMAGARTILVDAVLPEKGWGSPLQPGGWLTPANDFLRRATDVQVMRMLSAEAAQRFAAEGLVIDYLHIDGDHSTAGVLADFADFSPLVRVGGVISLHDLHLAEVRLAIARIRARYPGWEYMAFAELGAGSAFFRRIALPLPSPLQRAGQGLRRAAQACRQAIWRHPRLTMLALLRALRRGVLRWQGLSALLLRGLRRWPWLHAQLRRLHAPEAG